jgi:hypothetical protein
VVILAVLAPPKKSPEKFKKNTEQNKSQDILLPLAFSLFRVQSRA